MAAFWGKVYLVLTIIEKKIYCPAKMKIFSSHMFTVFEPYETFEIEPHNITFVPIIQINVHM